MKQFLALALMVPLTACFDDSEDTSIEVTGELPSTSSGFSETAGLANAGALVGNDTKEVFGESLTSNAFSGGSANSFSTGIQSRELLSPPQNCDSSGTVSLDVSDKALTFIFEECLSDNTEIDGRLGFTITGDLETFAENIVGDAIDLSLNADYQNIKVTTGSEYLNLDGNITTRYQISSTDWGYGISSSALEYSDSNDHDFTLNNYNLEMQGDFLVGEASDGTSWSYDYFITNSDGTFHVQSDGDIQLHDSSNELRTGTILIEGTNATLAITLNAEAENVDDQVNFSLDLGKDGTEDVTGTTSQATFYGWPQAF